MVRILTYNIHSCRGIDGRLSPERIASVIAACEPEIVLLQEVDVGRQRTGHIDQAEVIARLLGMSLQFHPSITLAEERYGDAILSTLPLKLIKAAGLSGASRLGREPRGALWVSIDVGGTKLQLVNTHLGVFPREQISQVDDLLGPQWLGHPDCRDPVVLAGDFNSFPGTRTYRRFAAGLQNAQRGGQSSSRFSATFPSRAPLLRLDHVWFRGKISVRRCEVVRTPLARVASDHLPLVVDLDFTA